MFYFILVVMMHFLVFDLVTIPTYFSLVLCLIFVINLCRKWNYEVTKIHKRVNVGAITD